jgi:alcohol dehydrogenase (cytochrome c)
VNATDAVTGEIVASTDLAVESRSSVLATGGGLIFFGDSTGLFQAYDSDTLQQVWSMNLGGQILSAAISYGVGGKQYIAVQTGGMPTDGGFFGAPQGPNSSNLFVFGL